MGYRRDEDGEAIREGAAGGVGGGGEPAGDGTGVRSGAQTVSKMLEFSAPPGYQRQKPVRQPKPGPWQGAIDAIVRGVARTSPPVLRPR